MSRSRTVIALFVAGLCVGGCNQTRKEARSEISPPMEQMITALRGAYAAFNRGDIDAAVQPLDANIEWSEPTEFPGGGTYHGRDGVKRYLSQSRSAWAEASSEPEQFIAAGDRIIVFVHARVRAKGSEEWQDVRLADVYTVREGMAVQMRAFADRQEALRWVGAEGTNR
ncbi:MAG TPA: nuclear transport factor 2 family protein [Granulicella sp.]|jgi:ketosteroid isomerase-like protein|nr:nuclear transport factor 2 family protein [Granulicella sp.]